MITKIAIFVSVTAFALFGAIAQAKVFDPSESQRDVYEQIRPLFIDQTPFLFGCEVGSYEDPARDSAIPSHQESMPDIFAGNSNILDDQFSGDTCEVPILSPEQFRNYAWS